MALFAVAATPLMVRHHFLMVAAGVVDGAADAAMVNMPDTLELLVVVHETAGIVAVATAGVGAVTLLMARVVLVAVRLDVSVTVTWYVTDPFAHAVESNWNCAEVRLMSDLVQQPVDESKFP